MNVTITVRDTGMDIPELECSGCGVLFGLTWNRTPIYDGPEFCPFCGEAIDEVDDRRDTYDIPLDTPRPGA